MNKSYDINRKRNISDYSKGYDKYQSHYYPNKNDINHYTNRKRYRDKSDRERDHDFKRKKYSRDRSRNRSLSNETHKHSHHSRNRKKQGRDRYYIDHKVKLLFILIISAKILIINMSRKIDIKITKITKITNIIRIVIGSIIEMMTKIITDIKSIIITGEVTLSHHVLKGI